MPNPRASLKVGRFEVKYLFLDLLENPYNRRGRGRAGGRAEAGAEAVDNCRAHDVKYKTSSSLGEKNRTKAQRRLPDVPTVAPLKVLQLCMSHSSSTSKAAGQGAQSSRRGVPLKEPCKLSRGRLTHGDYWNACHRCGCGKTTIFGCALLMNDHDLA